MQRLLHADIRQRRVQVWRVKITLPILRRTSCVSTTANSIMYCILDSIEIWCLFKILPQLIIVGNETWRGNLSSATASSTEIRVAKESCEGSLFPPNLFKKNPTDLRDPWPEEYCLLDHVIYVEFRSSWKYHFSNLPWRVICYKSSEEPLSHVRSVMVKIFPRWAWPIDLLWNRRTVCSVQSRMGIARCVPPRRAARGFLLPDDC